MPGIVLLSPVARVAVVAIKIRHARSIERTNGGPAWDYGDSSGACFPRVRCQMQCRRLAIPKESRK